MELRAHLRELVDNLPRERLPEAIGALAEAQALASARLSGPHENGAPPVRNGMKALARHLTAVEAAEILGVDTRWLYRRADKLPFTRKLGPRTLRFDEAALRRWLETRK